MKSTISAKGQVTIPVHVRNQLGLRPGTPVTFELRERDVVMRKGRPGQHPVDRVFRTLRLKRPVDALLDEMRGHRPKRS